MNDAGGRAPDDLQQQQRWLQAAISAANPATFRDAADRYLQSSAALAATARLGIYQRAYWARLLQSFHAIFPGLLQALGATALNGFAQAFLTHSQPHHYSINRIADGFADYLHQTRPGRADGSDWAASTAADCNEAAADLAADAWAECIVDLARLEAALLQVSEAPGLEQAAPPRPELLREASDAELQQRRPCTAPCLRLLACRYPVHDYLQQVRAGQAAHLPAARPVCLALTRVHYRLAMRELAPVQWQLLLRLDGGTPLTAVLHAVAELGLRPVPSLALARIWLGNFLAQGLIRS